MHQETPSNLISYDHWLNGLNKTRVTGFRWRKLGLIETVNIFGRLYVTREGVAEFERRAIAGEFSRESTPPTDRSPRRKRNASR